MTAKRKKVAAKKKKTATRKPRASTRKTRAPRKKTRRSSKKKAGFQFKPDTKKRIFALSIWMNLLVFALGAYAIHQAGFENVYRVTQAVVSAPFKKLIAPKESSKPTHVAIKPTTSKPQKPKRVKRTLSADKPKLVFVIDDIGHTMSYRQNLRKLGNQVTYAILPMLRYSRFFSLLSVETGAEVILHLPLESSDGTIPGPGLITGRMPKTQVLDVLRRGLASVPHHIGVNNHMGSKGTSNPELMGIILRELKKRDLFFLDSFTTAQSVSSGISRSIGLPTIRRDVFLDNTDSQAAIRVQVKEMAMVARRKGHAIGIGHYRFNTLNVLQSQIPALKKQGFEIVSLMDLIEFLERQ